jgi:hypothetical protein
MSTNIKISTLNTDYEEINIVMPNGGTQKVLRESVGNNVTISSRVTSGDVKDKHHVHHQASPDSSWTVAHNLGKKPSVTVVDSADEVVHGQIEYIDNNTVTLTFAGSFSGKAYFN